MTEQEFIKKIAIKLHFIDQFYKQEPLPDWEDLEQGNQSDYLVYATLIHTIYKEAGYKSPEEVAEFILSVNKALSQAQGRVGYVKLAEDQRLSSTVTGRVSDFDCLRCFEESLRQGWRKVELEGGK